jgi:hypothetical protein
MTLSPGRLLLNLLHDLDRRGVTVIDLIRRGQPLEPWRLYPGESGIFDRQTRYQFYFHVHPDSAPEAGHFHTVRLFSDHTAHVVAISMDKRGWPQALFTVNLWATGGADEPPERLKQFARQFHVDERRGPREVVTFVNLICRAFLPEIEGLQDAKARTLAAYRETHPDRDPFDDRTLEVLSRVEIDVRTRAPARRRIRQKN